MATFRETALGEIAQLKRRESEIAARRHDLSQPSTDISDLAEIASRFDSAYVAVGAGAAPAPLPHETRFSYRRRLASGLQRFSDSWRQSDLYRLGTDAMRAAEQAILADVSAVCADLTIGNQDGSLRRIDRTNAAGHRITEWAGNPASWLSQFAGPAKAVKQFRNPTTGAPLMANRRSIS
jgi:hypothetical protein